MLIENVIRKLKHNPDYKWDCSYSLRDLFIITEGRVIQLMRGAWKKLFFKESHGLVFIGSHVTIKHPHLFSSGENLILDDNTYINALSSEGIHIKNNVSLSRNCTIICTGVIANKGKGVTIGNNSGINSNAYLAGQGGIEIGDNVIIGPDVKIFSENHNFSDPNVIIKEQGVSRSGVVIKNDCWIGANVTVLAGVTIGEGCVIAAGSVITKSVPAYSIVAGIPGRVMKTRKQQAPVEEASVIKLNISA
jgi:acetyltransferase-like isoleucine patch superfamily enzyme